VKMSVASEVADVVERPVSADAGFLEFVYLLLCRPPFLAFQPGGDHPARDFPARKFPLVVRKKQASPESGKRCGNAVCAFKNLLAIVHVSCPGHEKLKALDLEAVARRNLVGWHFSAGWFAAGRFDLPWRGPSNWRAGVEWPWEG